MLAGLPGLDGFINRVVIPSKSSVSVFVFSVVAAAKRQMYGFRRVEEL
jgi:hypothetical protein